MNLSSGVLFWFHWNSAVLGGTASRELLSIFIVITETVQPRAAGRKSHQHQLALRKCTANQGGEAMTKSVADFAERNTERAVQVTKYGMDWLRKVAEQNLDQSKASVETLVIATWRKCRSLADIVL